MLTSPSIDDQKLTSATREQKQTEFDRYRCWYPIVFLQDLPSDRPYHFSLYDEPFVLFRDANGQLGCLVDRCPHRAAKLSDGQIIEGKLECLYHGWQFNTRGECLQIPQLSAEAKIPRQACLPSFAVIERQGLIWLWLGKAEEADEAKIPLVPALENPDCVCTDYLVNLPYDWSYLVENLVDPAHVNISHDRSEFGAKRENAQPLAMEVLETSARGILGRWRTTRNPNDQWKFLDFIAPSLVHYQFNLPHPDWCAGLALYAIPLGKGRSRLLLRRYQNFATRSRPYQIRWLEHLRQSKILEEDMPLIMGQQQQIAQLSKSLQELYLPLKTSDLLVVEYRKWLDRFGASLPFYEGYTTAQGQSLQPIATVPLDRLSRHTCHCSSCQKAYQLTIQLKQTGIALAIACVGVGIICDRSWSQILALVIAFALIIGFTQLETLKNKFE